MIAEATFHLLRLNPALIASDLTGIHYAERPERMTLPALLIERRPASRLDHAKGPSNAQKGSIRVIALAATYLGAGDLAKLAEKALNGWSGAVVMADDSEVRVRYADPQRADVPSDHRDGEGAIRTHGVRVDLDFILREPPAATAPTP